MARVLISVKDPLGIGAGHDDVPPLLIGQYVQIAIDGRQIENVFRIPRTALRDNADIWIAGKDGHLQIRRVQTLWRDIDTVLVKQGLEPGDRLIVSDLSTPIAGMSLNIELVDGGKQP